MANWGNVQQGLVSGFQVGQATGGKLAGIGQAIAKVANRLKEQRQMDEEQGRKVNLLGVEGLIEVNITPAEQGETKTTFEIPGMGKFKSKPSLLENVTISPEGELAYKVGDTFIPLKSISKSGFTTALPPKSEITKTTALNIISDPVKAEQLKMTYPDVYSLIENIAQEETQQTSSFKPPKINTDQEDIIAQYIQKYPNRNREEIIKTMKKQGLL